MIMKIKAINKPKTIKSIGINVTKEARKNRIDFPIFDLINPIRFLVVISFFDSIRLKYPMG